MAILFTFRPGSGRARASWTYRMRVLLPATVASMACGAVVVGVALIVARASPPPPFLDPGWIYLSSAAGDLPVPGKSDEQTASLVLDIDKDGINDFVIGMRKEAPALVWFRRGVVGWAAHVIERDRLPIEAGGAVHDIDGDGDLDIVMGEDARGNKIYWWENPHPMHDRKARWKRRLIKSSGANQHHDQIFGDFDGDGDAELAFWNQKARRLFIAEIPPDARAAEDWPQTPIFESDTPKIEGLAKADIDGDGRVDLIGGGRWFKHAGGTRYIAEVIDERMQFSRAAVGQLKPGGRPEVVLAIGDADGPLRWYEWNGAAWTGRDLLESALIHGHSLALADVDGDGHLDVFSAEMHTPGHKDEAQSWIFHGDGRGGFSRKTLSVGFGNHESRIADLDGDGDVDVLSKPYHWQAPRIEVLLNRASKLDRWQRHVVDDERPWRSIFIAAADVDGDGDNDIVTGGWWYENAVGESPRWIRHAIGAPLYNMAAVGDFDGDGDSDILGTQAKGSMRNADFAWGRNDGGGSFTVLPNVASGAGDFLQGVAVGRFGETKQMQAALSWHKGGEGVQALDLPVDPSRERWSLQQISGRSQDEALSAGDIDNDGDLDLLLGTVWLENAGPSWLASTIDPVTGKPDRNRLADINVDGRLDAVVGFEAVSKPGDVVWYAQPANPHDHWIKHVIATVTGPMSLDVGDIDGDGDLDLVVGEHNTADPDSAKLYVLENADRRGQSWIGHIVWKGDEHHDGAILSDIDGDGDMDIVSIGWTHSRVLLYENTMR